MFRFAKEFLGEEGYSYLDSAQTSWQSATRQLERDCWSGARGQRARSGSSALESSLVKNPGVLTPSAGQMMNDALDTSIGKPGTDLKVIYIGTLAPAKSGWWHDLIAEGTNGSTYVHEAAR